MNCIISCKLFYAISTIRTSRTMLFLLILSGENEDNFDKEDEDHDDDNNEDDEDHDDDSNYGDDEDYKDDYDNGDDDNDSNDDIYLYADDATIQVMSRASREFGRFAF